MHPHFDILICLYAYIFFFFIPTLIIWYLSIVLSRTCSAQKKQRADLVGNGKDLKT